jgi:hypothetical protein
MCRKHHRHTTNTTTKAGGAESARSLLYMGEDWMTLVVLFLTGPTSAVSKLLNGTQIKGPGTVHTTHQDGGGHTLRGTHYDVMIITQQYKKEAQMHKSPRRKRRTHRCTNAPALNQPLPI